MDEGIWSLIELEELREAAVEAYAWMECEQRDAERRSQKAHRRMEELAEELATFAHGAAGGFAFCKGG